MANNQAVNIKWLHQSGEYRRYLLEQSPGVDIYELLLQKIRTGVPDFNGTLAWKDEDGDMIVFSNCAEMKEALAFPCNQNVFRIYTVGYNKSKEEEKRDAEKKAEESIIPKRVDGAHVVYLGNVPRKCALGKLIVRSGRDAAVDGE